MAHPTHERIPLVQHGTSSPSWSEWLAYGGCALVGTIGTGLSIYYDIYQKSGTTRLWSWLIPCACAACTGLAIRGIVKSFGSSTPLERDIVGSVNSIESTPLESQTLNRLTSLVAKHFPPDDVTDNFTDMTLESVLTLLDVHLQSLSDNNTSLREELETLRREVADMTSTPTSPTASPGGANYDQLTALKMRLDSVLKNPGSSRGSSRTPSTTNSAVNSPSRKLLVSPIKRDPDIV